MSIADMMTTVTSGSPTAAGGSSPKAMEFAQNICTKLGNCEAIGHAVAASTSKGGHSR